MTYFPTYTDADQCLQQHSECLAEAGMGACSLGYDGYDGMAEYNASMSDDQLDYLGACRWRLEALRDTVLGPVPVFSIDPQDDGIPF